MTHPAAPGDERWIQPGGLPSDDYFVAVTNAIAGRGIAVASSRRPYGWELELMLAPAASARDRLEISLRDGVVSERCRSWSWCAAVVLAAATEEPPDGPRPDLRGDDSDGISDHVQ